jgi:hypothetical protein
MPRKRCAGWPSLWVTFLLATQEKSDSPSAGGRNALHAKQQIAGMQPIPQRPLGPAFAGVTGVSSPASTRTLTPTLSQRERG